MKEDALQAQILEMCGQLDLLAFHAYDSRRDRGAGFPDLVIAGAGGVLFRELKNDYGQLRPHQQRWRYRLLAGGGDYGVWRPSQWRNGWIERELRSVR